MNFYYLFNTIIFFNIYKNKYINKNHINLIYTNKIKIKQLRINYVKIDIKIVILLDLHIIQKLLTNN